jgi:hypothetical protein
VALRPALVPALIALAGCATAGCATTIRRDHPLEPKPEGTKLTAFGYYGPGGRLSVDNRVDIEEGSTQLQNQVWADVNYGYSGISAHSDLRLLVLSLGGSVGYNYVWHSMTFEPDETGLDHGESELTRDLRVTKDEEDDFDADHWPYAEARARLVLPFYDVIFLSTVALRWEDQPDQTYNWEVATVYDGGMQVRWETFLFFKHRHYGFIGPGVRFLNVPYREERRNEMQYGLALGTTPGWSRAEHTLIFRILTTAGFDNDLMGVHTYRSPIQFILGYSQDIEL